MLVPFQTMCYQDCVQNVEPSWMYFFIIIILLKLLFIKNYRVTFKQNGELFYQNLNSQRLMIHITIYSSNLVWKAALKPCVLFKALYK